MVLLCNIRKLIQLQPQAQLTSLKGVHRYEENAPPAQALKGRPDLCKVHLPETCHDSCLALCPSSLSALSLPLCSGLQAKQCHSGGEDQAAMSAAGEQCHSSQQGWRRTVSCYAHGKQAVPCLLLPQPFQPAMQPHEKLCMPLVQLSESDCLIG